MGLATPPKLVSPTVNKSPSVDFTDLQYKLKSVVPPIVIKGTNPPPLLIKGASPVANVGVANMGVAKGAAPSPLLIKGVSPVANVGVANVGVAKGATPPPLLIKGALPGVGVASVGVANASVGVSVPSSRGVITSVTKGTSSHTNVITSCGITPPTKATPTLIDSRHKVVKKAAKLQSVQLPKQTIDALLSVLKNTNSSIYTNDLAQLVTVTTRQQTTPTQRPITSSPSQSSLRIVQAPPPATPTSTLPSTNHYYVTTPSVQYIPTTTSGVSLITSNLFNKTTSNN